MSQRWEEVLSKSMERAANESVNVKEISFGIVDSLEPLIINDEGLPLYSHNLIINEDLLPHTEHYSSFTGTIGDDTRTYKDVTVEVKGKLKVGDEVALREITDSKKIVLFKVKRG